MTWLPLALRVLAMMQALSADAHEPPPRQSTHVVAVAIAVAALDAEPLYQDDEARVKTAALLVVMSHQESRWRMLAGDCRGMKPGATECTLDKAASVGAWQQNVGAKTIEGQRREEFAVDAFAQARVALASLRVSFRVCPKAPLNWYAMGRDPKVACESEKATRLSAYRMAKARWLAKTVQP